MFKMVVLDVDGTILNNAGKLSPRTRRAVSMACRRGASVILATARPPRTLGGIYDALNLSTPTINYNGSLIFDMERKAPIWRLPLGRETVRNLVEWFLGRDCAGLILEVNNKFYADASLFPAWWLEKVCGRFPPSGLIEDYLQSEENGACKVLARVPEENTGILIKVVGDAFEQVAATSSGEPGLIEISARETGKDRAVDFLAEQWGVSWGEILAIGDAPNDIALIKKAGLGVAMGNSPEEVKKSARLVAPTNEEDGSAVILESFFK